ncbi:hypothetical protein [Streptacidiphilus sp. MAP5-3]|uniref:hypothetical protein n=1 Tax=unclassified Streptacidiphilus TaxID=2643834 RepID=UPI003511EBEA
MAMSPTSGQAGFTARTGHEVAGQVVGDRAPAVAQAWESLQQIRRLMQPEHPDLPAPWERARPLQAVGLALEAAGAAFCALDGQGAVVEDGLQISVERPGVLRVVWQHRRGHRPVDAGEAHLGEAARVLGEAGWDALVYRAGRQRFLLVEAGR